MSVKEKLKALLAEYGPIAIVIYFVIFLAVFAGFYVSISGGFEPDGVGESMGTLGATWLATKLTQPLRIGATLLLTPIVGAVLKRYRRTPVDEAVGDGDAEADGEAEADGVADADGDGEADGDEDADGETDADADGDEDAKAENA